MHNGIVDDDLRALLSKPFDLGTFDKDIGWCGDWHTLTTEDGVHFHVLREADENGVRTSTQRFVVALETVDREAGVLVLRGGAHELVFDLRSGAAVQSAFTPTGSIPLVTAPAEASLEPWLASVSSLFRSLGLARSGAARVAWEAAIEPRLARLFVGDEAVATARLLGAPVQDVAIDGAPGKRLLLRWSRASPRWLHVVGEVLPRSSFLPFRRALVTGLGWTPRPDFALRLLRDLAADVLAAPEIVDPTTHAARGEALWAVREVAGTLARLASATVEAAGLGAAIAGLTEDPPEAGARAILATPAPIASDLPGFHSDLSAWIDLEDALAAAPSRRDEEAALAGRLRTTLRASAPPDVPPTVVAALAAPGAEAMALLRAWRL